MRFPGALSLIWLVALIIAVGAAGFFAPYDPARQNRFLSYAPPTPIHLKDPLGRWYWRPFVCALAPSDTGTFGEDCRHRAPISLFVSGAAYQIGRITLRAHLFGSDASAELHLMGTDAYGRDQFSRFLYGGQISLIGALVACVLSLFFAAILGISAGFFGGRTDDLVMGLSELFLVLPWLYALFAIRAFLPLNMTTLGAFLVMWALIGGIGWARPAKLLRDAVLTAKEREYVLAARGFGASSSYLLLHHLLPQTRSVLLPQACLLISRYILAEVTLSFLGLGISEPVPSWGNMLSALQQYSVLRSYWWMLLPALALIPTFYGFLTLARRLSLK